MNSIRLKGLTAFHTKIFFEICQKRQIGILAFLDCFQNRIENAFSRDFSISSDLT